MTPPRYRRYIIGMSGRIFVAPHHSIEELERRYKAADDGIERGHLHIIWLLSQGRSAKFVAEVTGYTPTWVSKILWRYNDHGLAGLGDGRLDNPPSSGPTPCSATSRPVWPAPSTPSATSTSRAISPSARPDSPATTTLFSAMRAKTRFTGAWSHSATSRQTSSHAG